MAVGNLRGKSYTFLDENTIRTFIENAVSAAVNQLRTDLTALISSRVEPLAAKVAQLEVENTKLRSNIGVMHDEIVDMRDMVHKTQSELNDCQQYTRKSNIRVFGVTEDQGEDCKKRSWIYWLTN